MPGLSKIKNYLGKSLIDIYHAMMTLSLKKAIREQGLLELKNRLEELVPDIRNQYSMFEVNTPYLMNKVRNLHAFQISLFNSVAKDLGILSIVDIGDSAGTHLQYISGLYSKNKKIRGLSINIDELAVERIRGKGLEAINARAEDLDKYNIHPDVFLCFEVLEHLMDPCRFLYGLSSRTKTPFLIVTVPYLKKSRVGLRQIRDKRPEPRCAENTHIFELSPEDWKLLIKHSGWKIVKEQIYLQYPTKSIFRLTKYFWKKFDFEGFYGAILARDDSWSSQYLNW